MYMHFMEKLLIVCNNLESLSMARLLEIFFLHKGISYLFMEMSCMKVYEIN